ncbi:MAG: DegT/DnrJ/EryC1/StrS aminotransferase family protein [Pseudomonadota bacterium]
MKIEFYKHNIGDEEKQKINECLDGIFLTTGSYVAEFEKNFADYLGAKYAVGLTSCTAALHLSLLALGIGPGDEVITTPMTFIATATAIIHAGAKPVFVDVEKDTALLDSRLIKQAITNKTKAIIPVHLYGQMCDMKQIKNIADQYNLKIIEDAAHCIEAKRDGIVPGQLGDVACFSFYATKNITSGEGGAIVTNSKKIADRIRLLRMHGMSKEASDRYSGKYQHWDMITCGWKYNMDNLQASLLLPQLKKIDLMWELRAKVYEKYIACFNDMPDLSLPVIRKGSKSAYHLFTIWTDSTKRDGYIHQLGESGIGVAVNYRAIHLLTYFRETFGFNQGDFPIAEEIGNRTISLPFWARLSDLEINMVCQIIKKII